MPRGRNFLQKERRSPGDRLEMEELGHVFLEDPLHLYKVGEEGGHVGVTFPLHDGEAGQKQVEGQGAVAKDRVLDDPELSEGERVTVDWMSMGMPV